MKISLAGPAERKKQPCHLVAAHSFELAEDATTTCGLKIYQLKIYPLTWTPMLRLVTCKLCLRRRTPPHSEKGS